MSKNLIAEMMLENTGTHFLDSGGACGRAWQRNQERDFECERATSLTFRWDYIEVTHNIYHWLKERIEPDDEMQALFDEMVDESDPDEYWMSLMERFPKWLAEHKDIESGGIYGEGEPFTVNTYNGECLLSQVLQYTYFETDDGAYYLLQIHGGADVRGGYTEPKVFQENGHYSEPSLTDNARASIQCKPPDISDFERQFGKNVIERIKQNLKLSPKHQLKLFQTLPDEITRDEHSWSTDDGYHWYFEGYAGYSAGKQLEEYEITDDETLKGKGAIFRDDEGNGYCPLCGYILEAW